MRDKGADTASRVCVCSCVGACAYPDDLGEARVFAPFVLDELVGLRQLAAQLGRVFLKLLSSRAFKLKQASLLTSRTRVAGFHLAQTPSPATDRNASIIAEETPLTLASMMSPMS